MNPAFHKRSKHFLNHYHYVREQVALGNVRVSYIPNYLQLADVFTKSLPLGLFSSLRFKLGVDVPPTPSLRGTISRESKAEQFCLPKAKEEEERSTKAELKDKKVNLASERTPNDTVGLSELKQQLKPSNMVWKPKAKQEPIMAQEQQRLSAKEEDRNGELEIKEASRKNISSCLGQDLILTNRFRCVEGLT